MTTNNDIDAPLVLGHMSDFDKLPKVVREALRYSDHNWSATMCLRELRKRKVDRWPEIKDPKTLAAYIHDMDRDIHYRDAARGIICGGQRP